MSMRRFWLLLITLVIAAGLLLTSCDPVANTTTTPTSATPTVNPTATTKTTTPPVSGGGVLKLYGDNPYTLDPALSSDANSSNYILQIFSGLLRLDANLDPAPDIAASWEISPDKLTYTFHLREDVTFHNGKKLTAADVKYSWERACNPSTRSPVARTYLGDIAGAMDVITGKAKEISGVKILNDYTLQVTITTPINHFLAKLTYPTAMIVDKQNVGSSQWYRQPNGTGPFKLKGWQANSLLILERNDAYFGKKAKLARVEFQMLTGVPMNLYETGEIDVTGLSADYIDRVTDPAGPFFDQLQVSPQLSFQWIGFNTTEPPFDDINVRKAFNLAIDKDKIISLILRDLVDRADGILPSGIPGYNADLKGLGFDAAAAQAALKASKYGSAADLPAITLTTGGYGNTISGILTSLIVQWRENLGVEVKVRQLDPDYYIYHLTTEKDQMFEMGWVADYPHPQDFLELLFHSGVENNYAEYSNPAVDAILDAAAVEPDTNKSLEMYRQAEQMLVDDAAMLPLYFGQSYLLVKPYVKGYVYNAMGFAWLADVWIEK
jgi:oligopeptide transport system substrate-binding protein